MKPDLLHSLNIDNIRSNIKGYQIYKSDSNLDYCNDKVTECLIDHSKCSGEYSSDILKVSFICYCKCHKDIKSNLEIFKKLQDNICAGCGNDHSHKGVTKESK